MTTGMEAQEKARRGPLIAATAILVAGLVLAILGAWAVVRSVNRENGLTAYRDARYSVTIGNHALKAARQICGCGTDRVALVRHARDAFLAGDFSRYNDLIHRQNQMTMRANSALADFRILISRLPSD